MTIEELKEKGWILMEAVVGSQSFGLATETSDTDVRGVYVLPMKERLSFKPDMRVADDKNNTEYWELSNFLQYLQQGNPNALELLNSPERCILKGKELFDAIPKDIWITTRVLKSYQEYAKTQLSRAYGLNKKMNNPCPEEAPQVLDYCYVYGQDIKCKPFKQFLAEQDTLAKQDQKWYGLAKIDHCKNTYALYYQDKAEGLSYSLLQPDRPPEEIPEHKWRWAYGVVTDEKKACDIQLAKHIPKGLNPVAFLTFNPDAFSHDCKEHTHYWNWVKKERNEVRYAETEKHGKGYDAKNTMHCIRLLLTAKNIALTGKVTVDCSDKRDYLLSIKKGTYSYEDMMNLSDSLVKEVEECFKDSKYLHDPVTDEQLDEMFIDLLASLPDEFSSLPVYRVTPGELRERRRLPEENNNV